MPGLYKPKLEDLWFLEEMWGDPETMSFNQRWGGTIAFPQEDWDDWYDYWLVNHEDKRFYRYLVDEANHKFIGEIAWHLNEDENKYLANIKIYAKYRGRGYGRQGLQLLMDEARKKGIDYLYDDIAIDNPAIKLFLDCGFVEVYRTEDIIMLKKSLR